MWDDNSLDRSGCRIWELHGVTRASIYSPGSSPNQIEVLNNFVTERVTLVAVSLIGITLVAVSRSILADIMSINLSCVKSTVLGIQLSMMSENAPL